jgi:hypothetical protein
MSRLGVRNYLQIPDMLGFERTETAGEGILNFLRYFSYNSSLYRLSQWKSFVLNCIGYLWTNEMYLTLWCERLLQQQIENNCVNKDKECSVHAMIGRALCKQAAAVKLAMQYRKFLSKTFKQYLIYSPGVKHVWEFKVVISKTYSNMR